MPIYRVYTQNILISDDAITIIQGMYKERIITHRLRKLVDSFPAIVISGARQVGKSTLLKHVYPNIPYVVFDPTTDIGGARKDPELFLENNPPPIILDEIQYAPTLVSVIKRRIDKDRRPGQYIMTGSQQWSVIKTMAESLAGRVVFLDLFGFCLNEITEGTTDKHWLSRWLQDPQDLIRQPPQSLHTTRSLFEQLWRGWLPEADQLDLALIPDLYSAYLRTYIERDLRLVSDVSDWQQFGRFVQLAAALTAQEINYSQFGRDIDVTPQTAHRWMSILQSTFQVISIPAFSGNTVKRISNKAKGYIVDTGLVCALQMLSSPKTLGGHPLAGPLFETCVVTEIKKLLSTLNMPPALHHWRSHGGAEVDLIMERDGILFPIEIKLTSQPNRSDTQGISAFRNTYPALKIAPGLVISPTDRFAKISDHDYALPWASQ